MDFSFHISNEDFFIDNVHHSLIDDDLAYLKKDHISLFNNNLSQSSISGWSPSPILRGLSNEYNQNLIPLIPNQNSVPLNQNLVTTQNLPVHNPSIAEKPSIYPFMSINSYSRTNTFEEPVNTITNNNQNYIAHDTPFPIKSRGIFDIFHDSRGNTMWGDTMHDKKVINSGYEPGVDKFMVGSHSFDLLVPDGVKGATIEVINQRQDHEMIETNKKKKMKVVKRSNHLRKAKKKWNTSDDRKLKAAVAFYGTKSWTLIARHFEGRVGKQCRERWHNHLCIAIKRDAWSEEEDQILIEAHKVAGNKWSKISLELPGRSENAIKNHWNAAKRRVLSMKIKQINENANMPHNSILENYIRFVTINNDPRKDTNIEGKTENSRDDDDSKNIFDVKMNLSLDVTTHTVKPSVNASTSSVYVQEPAMFSCDDYFTKVCESKGDIEMLMDGWE